MSVNNSLVSKGNQKLGLTAYLTKENVKAQIADVLGGGKGQQFITSIISAVNVNELLRDCTNESIVSGALLGASLNLTPSPQLGQFYLVPFRDKNKGMVAQFILGYHGMIQLAIRSGQYKKINVLPLKRGELVRFDPLDEEIEVNLIEDEDERDNAETIGYYASFTYVNGFRKAIYWSKKKMESHARRYSRGYAKQTGNTFWEKDFDAMACKTMLRQLLGKWGAMNTDMQTAYEGDGKVVNIKQDGSREFISVDNEPEAIAPPEKPEPKQEPPKAPEAPKAESPAPDIAGALFG